MLAIGIFGSYKSDKENALIKVGIVAGSNNGYLNAGIDAFRSIDTSRLYLEFVKLGEKEARTLLKSGELEGYLYIPDGFIDSVGEKKITYYMGNSSAALTSLLMQEFVDVIGGVVVETQCAMGGFSALAQKTELEKAAQKKIAEKLTVEYIEKILTREEWYELQPLGVGRGMSYGTYYLAAFIVLLIMLWGIACVNLLAGRDLALPRMLYSKGRGAVFQTAAEYLPFLALLFVNIALITTALFACGVGSLFLTAAALIPAVVLLSAMQFFLYELSSGVVNAVLLQILSLLALSIPSGLFYPSNSLPSALRLFGEWSPVGVAFSCAGGALQHSTALRESAIAAAYSALFLVLSAVARKFKIRGSRI